MKSVVLLVILVIVQSQAKVFSRCGLARELKRQNFPQEQIPDWVCLIEAESRGNTRVKGLHRSNKSHDWGLFQINDRDWCRIGGRGGLCQMNCSDFLKDDITKASRCARIIFNIKGFDYWFGWTIQCKGKILPDLKNCNV